MKKIKRNETMKSSFLSIFSLVQLPCFKCICQNPLWLHLLAVNFKLGWTDGGSCVIAGGGVGLRRYFHHFMWTSSLLAITALKVQTWGCCGWTPGESRVEIHGWEGEFEDVDGKWSHGWALCPGDGKEGKPCLVWFRGGVHPGVSCGGQADDKDQGLFYGEQKLFRGGEATIFPGLMRTWGCHRAEKLV